MLYAFHTLFVHFLIDYVAEYANRSKLPKEERAAAAKAGLMSRSLDNFQKESFPIELLSFAVFLCLLMQETTSAAYWYISVYRMSLEFTRISY